MNVDMNKVRAEMAEHWDMSADEFNAHEVNEVFEHGNGWAEIDFKDETGRVSFFIEVNANSEVWNFDWVVA